MSLKQKTLTGAKWVTLSRSIAQLLGVLSLVVYARLLTPDDFGLYAILMIFVGFLSMFTDMGTSSAIIHIKNPSHKLLSSVFYLNIIMGIAMFFTLLAITPLAAIFFERTEINSLLPFLAINFIIGSFNTVHSALYQKSMDFKRITLYEVVSTMLGLFFGIVLAYGGYGVYSLIAQSLASSLIMTILIWKTSDWRPLWHFSLQEIKQIWSYTANLTGFNFINYFARNADNVLIGKFLGSSSLGLYTLAYRIMLFPPMNISQVLIRILFPVFSQIQDQNDKFKKAYLRVIFFIALISFPLMIGLMATAEQLVNVLFGNKWVGLASLLVILAPVGLMQSIVTTTGSIYMAKGNTKLMFKIGTANSVLTVLSFFVGLPFGVQGVAISYTVANLLIVYPSLYYSWRQIELNVGEGLRVMLPIMISSIIMGILVFILGDFAQTIFNNKVVLLIMMIFTGVLVYLLLIRMIYGPLKDLFRELKA
jgi:PST family polysaccharide transporter